MPNQVLVAVFTGWKLERGRLHKFQTFIGKSDLRIGIRDTIAPHSQREIYYNSTLKNAHVNIPLVNHFSARLCGDF